jgi:hypothetical protein
VPLFDQYFHFSLFPVSASDVKGQLVDRHISELEVVEEWPISISICVQMYEDAHAMTTSGRRLCHSHLSGVLPHLRDSDGRRPHVLGI